MPALSVTPNIEANPWPESKGMPFGEITKIGRLPRGMESGRSTVTICITLADGATVYGQTSLRNMNAAMIALNARAAAEGEPA